MSKIQESKQIVQVESELLTYLQETLKYTNKEAKRLLSFKDVLLKGKVVSKFNTILKKGDTLEIIKSSVSKKNPCPLDIIYEDNDFIVINKPAGLLSISTEKEKEKTAYHIISEFVKENNKNVKIFILHRIDKDTSGVLVFAKDQNLRDLLQENWNEIVLKRGYYALCEGKLKNKKNRIVNYLKANRADIVYSVDKQDKYAQQAITNYEVIKENKDYSLLNVNIETGRKNQIRVTLNDLGNPIVGDKKYGSSINPIKRLGLHAYELVFINPANSKKYEFKTELPNEFKKLMK